MPVLIEGLNVENALALAARLRERADGLPQDASYCLEPLMEWYTHDTDCGTVGCIAGEFAQWKDISDHHELARFLELGGASGEIDVRINSDYGAVIYLEQWRSKKLINKYHAQAESIPGQLRVMASYLEWLTGAKA